MFPSVLPPVYAKAGLRVIGVTNEDLHYRFSVEPCAWRMMWTSSGFRRSGVRTRRRRIWSVSLAFLLCVRPRQTAENRPHDQQRIVL
jgi:hypothetical protein